MSELQDCSMSQGPARERLAAAVARMGGTGMKNVCLTIEDACAILCWFCAKDSLEEIRRRAKKAERISAEWGIKWHEAEDRATKAEAQVAEYEGVAGRCPIGHNKRFTYKLEGKIGCVACEREKAEAALADSMEFCAKVAEKYAGRTGIAGAFARRIAADIRVLAEARRAGKGET